jgi:hypothetical protein
VQWVAFGGGRLLAETTRDEQRKMIKYHHLVANLLVFHNVVRMTRALHSLIADGHQIDEEAIKCFSPYQTEHINQFGRYALKRDRVPELLERVRILRMPPRSEGRWPEKVKKSVTINQDPYRFPYTYHRWQKAARLGTPRQHYNSSG